MVEVGLRSIFVSVAAISGINSISMVVFVAIGLLMGIQKTRVIGTIMLLVAVGVLFNYGYGWIGSYIHYVASM